MFLLLLLFFFVLSQLIVSLNKLRAFIFPSFLYKISLSALPKSPSIVAIIIFTFFICLPFMNTLFSLTGIISTVFRFTIYHPICFIIQLAPELSGNTLLMLLFCFFWLTYLTELDKIFLVSYKMKPHCALC